jgi:hypothetical protein
MASGTPKYTEEQIKKLKKDPQVQALANTLSANTPQPPGVFYNNINDEFLNNLKQNWWCKDPGFKKETQYRYIIEAKDQGISKQGDYSFGEGEKRYWVMDEGYNKLPHERVTTCQSTETKYISEREIEIRDFLNEHYTEKRDSKDVYFLKDQFYYFIDPDGKFVEKLKCITPTEKYCTFKRSNGETIKIENNTPAWYRKRGKIFGLSVRPLGPSASKYIDPTQSAGKPKTKKRNHKKHRRKTRRSRK